MATNPTDRIGIDLKGRVKRIDLAERNMLLPVFEAIVNSIHAIEDAGISDGEVLVELERDAQTEMQLQESSIPPVVGFTIRDNGIGFNSVHYESFKREYSTLKAERGGLGLGRFMWLKAFTNVYIESVFEEDEKHWERDFYFNLRSTDGIERPSLKETKATATGSVVHLKGYKDPYRSKCPKKMETIANRIVEHCLIYFLNKDCPKIMLKDGVDRMVLNKHFRNLVSGNKYTDRFRVHQYMFKITLLKWFEHEEFTHNKIVLCASSREVEDFNVNKVLPDVSGKVKDQSTGDEYLIVGYVEGAYFDEHVNDERTEISFRKNELFDGKKIKEQEFYDALRPVLKKRFGTEVQKFYEEKVQKINNFISERAPQYKILNKYSASFEDVVVTDNTSDEDLDLKLYRKYQDIDFQSRKEAARILSEDEQDEDQDSLKEKYYSILDSLTDMNKAKLAQYVVHRKYIIDLFEKSLALNAQGKYELEDTVHSIVFPTKKSSEDIDYNDQNLWLIDERLSFHTYLSSDQPLNSLEGFEGDSADRPDLMIFNNPISYVEGDEGPFNSVVLVEFKRPMRKGYNEADDNPIIQVFNYVRKIRDGKKLTLKGRNYPIGDHTIFYCYVICDLNDKIAQYSENANLERTHDGRGFSGYNKAVKCLIEVMPFDQVLSNAKKRNKVLFSKLGI